jgi:hypothetical protein
MHHPAFDDKQRFNRFIHIHYYFVGKKMERSDGGVFEEANK